MLKIITTIKCFRQGANLTLSGKFLIGNIQEV